MSAQMVFFQNFSSTLDEQQRQAAFRSCAGCIGVGLQACPGLFRTGHAPDSYEDVSGLAILATIDTGAVSGLPKIGLKNQTAPNF